MRRTSILLALLVASLVVVTGCKRKNDGKIKQPGKSQYALVADADPADPDAAAYEDEEYDDEDEDDGDEAEE